MREARHCDGGARSPVRSLEGGVRPLRLQLAVWRQRPLPRHHPQASVWRRPAGSPHALQVWKPDRLPRAHREIWSLLLQRWDWNIRRFDCCQFCLHHQVWFSGFLPTQCSILHFQAESPTNVQTQHGRLFDTYKKAIVSYVNSEVWCSTNTPFISIRAYRCGCREWWQRTNSTETLTREE